MAGDMVNPNFRKYIVSQMTDNAWVADVKCKIVIWIAYF